MAPPTARSEDRMLENRDAARTGQTWRKERSSDGRPGLLRRSLSWSQGAALAQHVQLKPDADIDV